MVKYVFMAPTAVEISLSESSAATLEISLEPDTKLLTCVFKAVKLVERAGMPGNTIVAKLDGMLPTVTEPSTVFNMVASDASLTVMSVPIITKSSLAPVAKRAFNVVNVSPEPRPISTSPLPEALTSESRAPN